jgi:hypothetical protein
MGRVGIGPDRRIGASHNWRGKARADVVNVGAGPDPTEHNQRRYLIGASLATDASSRYAAGNLCAGIRAVHGDCPCRCRLAYIIANRHNIGASDSSSGHAPRRFDLGGIGADKHA